MGKENSEGNIELPVNVSELGEIKAVEAECPGVYYISALRDGSFNPILEEYYIVLDNAPISPEARQYGIPLNSGDGLVYSISRGESGCKVIYYEVLKYKYSHGLPLPKGETLYECSLYGVEIHPSYFGALPVPILTPWGHTTRSPVLANGIYWLETDQCSETLAVCFPIWRGDLSEAALHYARQTDYDEKNGIENTYGYLFFSEESICVAVFELLKTRSAWLSLKKVDLSALMNAIWWNCPEYAVAYNAWEQRGLHDPLGQVLRTLGYDVELSGSIEHMIFLTPDAGTDYWRWQ